MRQLLSIVVLASLVGCVANEPRSDLQEQYLLEIELNVSVESELATFSCKLRDQEASFLVDAGILAARCNDLAFGYLQASDLSFEIENPRLFFNHNGKFTVITRWYTNSSNGNESVTGGAYGYEIHVRVIAPNNAV